MSSRSSDAEVLSAAIAVRADASLPQEGLVRRLAWCGGVGALAVAATGLVVLFGWAFHVDTLIRVSPGLVTMKVNTAASLTTIGAALFLSTSSRLGRARSVVIAVLACLVGLLAGFTLLEYATGTSFGFDNPFGLDPGEVSTLPPGRMSAATAVCLLLLTGSVLMSLRNALRMAQIFATLSLTVGVMAIVGYSYGVESLYRFGPFTSVAVHTATAVVVASLAALSLRAGEGYVALLAGNTAGGVIVRRLLPAAVIAPLVGGAMTVRGLRSGLFEAPFAFAMFVTLVAVAGGVLVWVQGTRLRHVDLRRAGAEDAFVVTSEAVKARDAMARALAASERHARQIVATAADGYIAMDAQGQVTDWNQAATTIFGWSRDAALGQMLEHLIFPHHEEGRRGDGLAGYLETGEGPTLGQVVELPARHQSGRLLVVELTVWSVEGTDSGDLHAFVRDVTERRLAEEELRQANEDLSAFAALVAHDLRTPLAAIKGFAEIMVAVTADGGTDPRIPEWAGRIQASSDNASALIDDILAFASIGRDLQEHVPVDLNSLVRGAVDEQISIHPRPATIDVQALPVVEGDSSLLSQLFANLLGNALKYVPADRVARIVVDAVSDPVSTETIIRVTDNGEAVKAEDRDRVFSMFQRGHDVRDVAGTGVGLALCRRVVERHDGQIWIETAPGGGTRFCIRLATAGSISSAGSPVG